MYGFKNSSDDLKIEVLASLVHDQMQRLLDLILICFQFSLNTSYR